MAIQDDFTVAVNGNIRHASGATHYTVLELHRMLQLMADDASVSSANDLLDITCPTPSDRSTDNIITLLGAYNIDDTAAEYLYAGSIKQGTAGTETIYGGLKVLGAVNNDETQIQIIQNDALYDPTPFWGTQEAGGYNGDAVSGVLMRILVKCRDAGADIDGKRIRVQARHWGDTYDFFPVTLGEGEAVAALGTTPDAQNNVPIGTVQAWAAGDIPTNLEGYQTIDLNNGAGPQPYYSKWTYNTNTLGLKAIWNWIKEITSQASPAADVYNMNGELFLGVTHEIAVTAVSGTWDLDVPEVLTWTTGSGQLLAVNHASAPTKMWIQLLTGIAPTGGLELTGTTSTAKATQGIVTTRTVPKVFLGSYTGTVIGAFGVGIDTADLTASDTIQDLLGATQTPPNNVTFTVSGLVNGHDYVLVGPKAAGNDFAFNQLTLKTTLSGAGETAVVCTAAIPVDTPAAGTIRIQLDTGVYRLIAYTSYATDTFTIASTSFTGVNAATQPRNVMITYIDTLCNDTSEAFTTIYNAPRSLYIRVRDGGASPIKTYESAGSLTAAGGGAVASRIADA
jgi:hypothetical protein